jgi:hypothetical protein
MKKTGKVYSSEYTNIAKVLIQVLTTTSMKMVIFWDVAACSLVDIDRRFRGAYCLHHRPEDRRQASPKLFFTPPTANNVSRATKGVKGKGKAVPLHAMEAHGGRGGIAPTHT